MPMTTDPNEAKRLLAAGIDPMTGEPWTLCGTTVTTRNERHAHGWAYCGGCGQPVAVNDKGVWVYA